MGLRRCTISIIGVLLLANLATISISSIEPIDDFRFSSHNSGIDIKPTAVSFNYPNSIDQDKYQMFSSNHPIANFNRPADLFVIDGMLGAQIRLTITLENFGANSSGVFPTQILVEHDEYTKFEILNTTLTAPSINPGSTTTVQYTWTPTYAGNHSLVVTALHPTDANSGNDILSRHLTVGRVYDNCDDFSSWSVGAGWSSNPDAAISKGVACHFGNGAMSNYGNSVSSSLSTPVWDFSDRHPNPTRGVGMSFFATGSAQLGDVISFQARKTDGSWQEIGQISGSIDPTVADGTSSWSTFTNTIGAHTLPLAPLQVEHLHSSSQFRYAFTSNSAGTDIGYWLDELIWYYDQRAGLHEYDWVIGVNNSSSAQRGQWSDQLVTIHNNGNVSDRYTPSLNAVPAEWEYSLLHENGGNIDPSIGIQVMPGESHNLRIKLKPGANSTVGANPYQLQVVSINEPSIIEVKNLQITVDPSFIPSIITPSQTALCSPGSSCEFFVEVDNIGEAVDTFSISVSDFNVLSGWTLGLSWDQTSQISISPGAPEAIKFVVSVPADADPDLTSSVWLEIASDSDPSKTDIALIKAKSAMVTIAEVGFDLASQGAQDWSLLPSEVRELTFTVWNNASRLDTFTVGADKQGGKTWSLVQPSFTSLAVNPGSSSTFTVTVQSPSTGQVGDLGPIITPWATSTLSNTNATPSAFTLLAIKPVYDLKISIVNGNQEIEPGVAAVFGIEIENDGNGPVDALISVAGLSDDWSWWVVVDGITTQQPIYLSPSYELNDVKYVEVNLLIPQEVGPNEDIDFTIRVDPEGGSDSNEEDNSVLFELKTAEVKIPEIIGFNNSTQMVRVEETLTIDYQIHNIGNIADQNIRATVQVQSMPQTDGVIVEMFAIDDIANKVEDGRWIGVAISASGNVTMRIVIFVEEHVQVGTNVALVLIVEGGEGEDGLPITKTAETLINVYERRDVTLEYSLNESSILGHSEVLTIYVWSNSSIAETLIFSPQLPDGWSLYCDGLNIEQSYTFTVDKSDGLRPSTASVLCKIIDSGRAQSDSIRWNITNEDGDVLSTEDIEFAFVSESDEVTNIFGYALSDTRTIVFGIVSLTIIMASLLLVLARGRRGEEEEYETEKYEREVVTGPPSSDVVQPQVVQPVLQVLTTPVGQEDLAAQVSTVVAVTQPLEHHPLVQQPQGQHSIAQQHPVVPPQAEQTSVAGLPFSEEIIDGYRVSELQAAGWTEEQIEWKRQSLEQSVSVSPPYSPEETVSSPIAETKPEDEGADGLGDAFTALGG
ncbi:MAG TPA: hypothetical protein EYN88_01765 [Candidatus Poseidoniales archaeon]|nr:hypothetical protein [Candidatus Poseidoniales archaeon]